MDMLTGLTNATSGDATILGNSIHTGMGEIRRNLGVWCVCMFCFDNAKTKTQNKRKMVFVEYNNHITSKM